MGIKDLFKSLFTSETEPEEELTEIATNSWINVYYKILFQPPKTWTKQKIESHLGLVRNELAQIVMSLGQVVVNGEIKGFINQFLGNSAFMVDGNMPDSFMKLNFRRNFTFKFDKSKEHKSFYEILIRSKEKGENTKPGLRDIKKGEKVTYGYSPIDMAFDKFMLVELDKEISEYLDTVSTHGENTAFIDFNEKNEPIIRVKIGVLFMEHKVSDRLELIKKNPKIEEKAFGDKLTLFIEHYRKQIATDKKVARWIKEVDKLTAK